MSKTIYTNISTYNFKKGDRIKYTDPDNPEEEHLIEVLSVAEDISSTKKTLEVSVINSNATDLEEGATFSLIIDPTERPLLGFVFDADDPLSAIDEIYTVQDLIIYHTVAFLKSRHRSKYQASYSELVAWFKSMFGEDQAPDDDSLLKDVILPPIKKAKHLFKIKQGGYVQYVGSREESTGRRRMGGNLNNQTRIVDVQKITAGFTAFVVGLLESGILGDVEIKYD